MSLQISSNSIKIIPCTMDDKSCSDKVSTGSAWVNPYTPEKIPNKVKVGVLSTTIAGVGLALAILMKCKGKSFKPSEFFKGPIKNNSLWTLEYKEKEILALATGSVGGGLIGGMLFDKKENFKAKLREAVIQMVGNVAIPLGCVSLGVHGYHKFEKEILPNLKSVNKLIENNGKMLKSAPVVLVTIASLICGIFLGNKTGNAINKNVCDVDDKRKIKPWDMSPHLDDMCLAITLAFEKCNIGHIISRVIPVALMVAGYSTGITQEKPERCQ